ncbi:MAG: hypothetical protein ACXW2E_00095 [Nitrososphaeraceae archaeon]
MADPRNFTVKPCPTAYAAKSRADIGSAISNRRDFFNSVGKLGDLEVLNDIGGGAIGEGLRTVASISNSIRTGCGALPSVIGDSIDQGANWVLDAIGISPAVVETLRGLHPGIANQAWGQAKVIFEQIQQGHFKVTDIPYYLQDFQNLERLIRGIYTPGDDRLNSLSPICEASAYALDLIARAPKYKFLFVVQFVAAPGYERLDSVLRGMAFVVKKSTRPKITYNMEDVNYYNNRTKVVTKAIFEEMNMCFHDDILNNTTQFYTAYTRAMSPITNLTPEMTPTHSSYESIGLDYVDNTLVSNYDDPINQMIPTNKYAASIGPLANNNKQSIFKEIMLYHVFDNGHKVTVYHFLNPRISQLIPDDVDMSVGNEGNELSISFMYDNIFVETKTMKELSSKFEGAQSDALYPLRYNDAASATRGPNPNGLNPYGASVGSSSCDLMNTINTSGIDTGIFNGGFGGDLDLSLGDFI